MSKAIEDIAAERKRQIEVEGFDAVQDDRYRRGELALAAAAYAEWSHKTKTHREEHDAPNTFRWTGWDWKWWKPTTPRRDLVKAGALIIAEIERLDRLAAIPQEGIE